MPRLVPGIHVFLFVKAKTWMAGTSPAMTANAWLFAIYSALLTSLIRGSAFSISPR